jgi:hypothetical protein
MSQSPACWQKPQACEIMKVRHPSTCGGRPLAQMHWSGAGEGQSGSARFLSGDTPSRECAARRDLRFQLRGG